MIIPANRFKRVSSRLVRGVFFEGTGTVKTVLGSWSGMLGSLARYREDATFSRKQVWPGQGTSRAHPGHPSRGWL